MPSIIIPNKTTQFDYSSLVDRTAPLNNGLAAWWKSFPNFTGSKFIDIFNGYNANLNGATWSNNSGRLATKFIRASSQYANALGPYLSQNGQAITITAWFWSDDIINSQEIFMISNGTDATRLNINGAAGTVRAITSASGSNRIAVSSNTWLPNRWNFATAIFNSNNSSRIAGLNAVLGTAETTFAIPAQANIAEIGRLNSSGTINYFSGFLDDIRVYNRALSIYEIEKLYLAGLTNYRNEIKRKKIFLPLTSVNSSIYTNKIRPVLGIDYNNTINKSNSLNNGLVGFWMGLENQRGSNKWQDLLKTNTGEFKGNVNYSNLAVKIDGSSNSYISLPSPSIKQPPFTITAVASIDSLSAGRALWSASDNTSTSDQHALIFDSTNGNKFAAMSRSTGTVGAFKSALSITPNIDQIYVITGVWRSNSLREIYIDGQFVGNETTSVTPSTLNANDIGRLGDSTPNWEWNGKIYNLIAHNRDLSISEVYNLYSEIIKGYPNLLNYKKQFKPYTITYGASNPSRLRRLIISSYI